MSGEAIFIHNGLNKNLKGKEPKVSIIDHPYRVHKRIKSYIGASADKTPVSSSTMIAPADFDKVVDSIQNAPDIMEASDSIGVSLGERLPQYLATYAKAVSFLKEQIPTRNKQTLLGMEERPASDAQKARFLRVANVIADPYTLFDKIENNHVLKEEITAVLEVFPEFAQTIQNELAKVLVDSKMKNENFKLSKKIEKTLSKLVNVNTQAQMVETYQQNYIGGEVENDTASDIDSRPEATMTEPQRTEFE